MEELRCLCRIEAAGLLYAQQEAHVKRSALASGVESVTVPEESDELNAPLLGYSRGYNAWTEHFAHRGSP
jgi:hypothetical protein